jgi:hypothetical protein
MILKAFRLKAARFEHPAGTVCYACVCPDYGCARDDERATGKPHRSMTLDSSGDYPFFTVPSEDLEILKDEPVAKRDTKPEHELAYQEIADLLKRHAAGMTALELLAIAANMVGKIVAMQDQRTVSPEQAMRIVARNIEEGNKQAIEELMQTKGAKN